MRLILLANAVFALSAALGTVSPAIAQDAPAVVAPTPPPPQPHTPEALVEKSVHDLERGRLGAVVKDDVKALRSGPLLIHGNYCGLGNRPGRQPTDALDAACMRHDACTQTDKLPSCACDDRLRLEATAIAKDPATPPDLRATAGATAAAMAVLICKVAPAVPPSLQPAAAPKG